MHTLSVFLFLVASALYTYGGFFLVNSLGQSLRGHRYNANLDLYLLCAGHTFVALGYLAGGY